MKEINLKVTGMACGGCENRIQNTVKTIDGVEEAYANHNDETVKIVAKEDVLVETIKEKIEDIGFTVVGEV